MIIKYVGQESENNVLSSLHPLLLKAMKGSSLSKKLMLYIMSFGRLSESLIKDRELNSIPLKYCMNGLINCLKLIQE
jgi:hypothetical protein